MLRTCNGTDPRVLDALGYVGNCGRVFDDIEHTMVCPHTRTQLGTPLVGSDPAESTYEMISAPSGTVLVQCVHCATLGDPLDADAVIHWSRVRSLAEANAWARWHDVAAGHNRLTVAQLKDHHHHPLSNTSCQRTHTDYPQPERHLYVVCTKYGTKSYRAEVFADLRHAEQIAERDRGFLAALPILADWTRVPEPEPEPEPAPAPAPAPAVGTAPIPDFVETTDIREAIAQDIARMEREDPYKPPQLIRPYVPPLDHSSGLPETIGAEQPAPGEPDGFYAVMDGDGVLRQVQGVPFSPYEVLVPRMPGDLGASAAEEIQARVNAAQRLLGREET
jgi:hypothetical protein